MKRSEAIGKKIRHIKTGAVATITDVGSWKNRPWIWIRLNSYKFGRAVGGKQCDGARCFWDFFDSDWVELDKKSK